MTSRRGFLSALIGSAAAMTLDVERLLWVPGRKLISIPAPNVEVDWSPQLDLINKITLEWMEHNRKHIEDAVLRNPQVFERLSSRRRSLIIC